MTNKPELKPCPFCGGEAEFYPNDIEGEENWVECCNAKCQATNGYVRRTPEEALSAWNTRSEPAAPSDVEKDIGTIECIGRCLGGAFERDLLTHAKLIRAHIYKLEAESKRLRSALSAALTWL